MRDKLDIVSLFLVNGESAFDNIYTGGIVFYCYDKLQICFLFVLIIAMAVVLIMIIYILTNHSLQSYIFMENKNR